MSAVVRKWLGSTVAASLLFLMPALLILIVFRLVPIEQAFYLSFTRWNGGAEPAWIGLGNFAQITQDPVFWAALRNNLLVLCSLPVWVLAPLIIAVIIHSGVPGAKFFRLMVFLPAVLSPVVIGAYFNVLLKYNGALNSFLRDIGLGFLAHQWLNDPNTVLPVMVSILIWATLGIGTIIYLAALAQVNPELYDAAELDGANWLQKTAQHHHPGDPAHHRVLGDLRDDLDLHHGLPLRLHADAGRAWLLDVPARLLRLRRSLLRRLVRLCQRHRDGALVHRQRRLRIVVLAAAPRRTGLMEAVRPIDKIKSWWPSWLVLGLLTLLSLYPFVFVTFTAFKIQEGLRRRSGRPAL